MVATPLPFVAEVLSWNEHVCLKCFIISSYTQEDTSSFAGNVAHTSYSVHVPYKIINEV